MPLLGNTPSHEPDRYEPCLGCGLDPEECICPPLREAHESIHQEFPDDSFFECPSCFSEDTSLLDEDTEKSNLWSCAECGHTWEED